ncbi:MAG: hypothetical protein ACR2PL_23080 [Dehalococcoidia bacterium]
MKRFRSLLAAPLAALVLAGGALVQPAMPTRAEEIWCFDDPVVAVNGHLLDIKVEQPLANILTMRSTTITVVIPKNVPGSVTMNDVSAFPMQTAVSRTGAAWSGSGAIPVTIVTSVSAKSNYPVQVAATPVLNVLGLLGSPSTATGTANTAIKLSTKVGG